MAMERIVKWVVVILMVAMVLWAFDRGMRRQHAIDCAGGHFCEQGV